MNEEHLLPAVNSTGGAEPASLPFDRINVELAFAQQTLQACHENVLRLLSQDESRVSVWSWTSTRSHDSHEARLPDDRPERHLFSHISVSPKLKALPPAECNRMAGALTTLSTIERTAAPSDTLQGAAAENDPAHVVGIDGPSRPFRTSSKRSSMSTSSSVLTGIRNTITSRSGKIRDSMRSSRSHMSSSCERESRRQVTRKSIVGPTEDCEESSAHDAAHAMKEIVKEIVTRPNYCVHEYYKTVGFAQKVARSNLFEWITLLVIFLNSIWIAVDTDLNKAQVLLQAHPIFQIAEHSFCFYFSTELFIRFLAFEAKFYTLRDTWFIFDAVLVAMMGLETWIMTLAIIVFSGTSDTGGIGNASILRMARLLRLTRMARMARLLREIPELVILVKGMAASVRSVATTLLMLIVVLYVFGIGFVQLTDGSEAGAAMFSSVESAMYTLLCYGVLCLDYVEDISNDLSRVHVLLPIVYLFFVLLAAFTVMNMLIGVLCEIVSKVATNEKEQILLNYAKEKLQDILDDLDKDGNQQISKHEFMALLLHKEACLALDDLGVDVVGLVDFADVIFEKEPHQIEDVELTFQEFIQIVMQLRGANFVTVKDIVDLRRLIQDQMTNIKGEIDKQFNNMKAVQVQLAKASGKLSKPRVPSPDAEPQVRHPRRPSTASQLSVVATKPNTACNANNHDSVDNQDSGSYAPQALEI